MKTFQTSTKIAPIISVGTYWGWFEYERLWGPQEKSDREEGYFVCQDYSHQKLGETIAKTANEVFAEEKPFKDVGVVSIKATKFGSPREYNFGDDWLDLDFEVEDDFFDRAEEKIFDPKYEERFEKYIKANWCSRDGFISAMPAKRLYDMHEVFRQLREDDCGIDDLRCFGSVIALLYEAARQDGELVDESDDAFYASMTGQLLERFTGNHSLSEFCTVLEPDQVFERFPEAKFMLEGMEAGRKDLADKLEKYLACNVSDEAKAVTRKAADERIKFVDEMIDRVRSVIEQFWSCGVEKVGSELEEIRDEWVAFFGSTGKVCAKDLPDQMTLGGLS